MRLRYIESFRMRMQYVAGRGELYQQVQRLTEANYVSMLLQQDLQDHHLGLRNMATGNMNILRVNDACQREIYPCCFSWHGS